MITTMDGKLTYDELLQKVSLQESQIVALVAEKTSIKNFQYFINESPDLVCITGTDGFFKDVNPAFTAILGYSKQEFLITPFLDFVHPDDLEKTIAEVNLLSTSIATIDFENRYMKKNGSVVHLQWKSYLNPANNLIYAIARDITEIRETHQKLVANEKFLNEAQKIAKIGSWDYNFIAQELDWSNELYEIFEIKKSYNKAKLYAKYLSRFLPEDIKRLEEKIKKSIATGTPYEMEHQIVFPNNKVKWAYCTGLPTVDSKNKLISIRGVIQDITQKKQIDENIKAKEKAEAANKAKSDFLANMSHEIRTPLNAIVGFTDLLLKLNFDTDQRQYLITVNQSANTLMDIINNILDFSKIESGNLELNSEEIDVFELCNQVINLFKFEANHKNIELVLDINNNVPEYILGDSFRLKQILVNLLSNAMKFTLSGSIQLNVKQIEESEGFSNIMFSVKDTGIGIKIQNQEKIFKSFVQADNTTTRKYGGTGLGLAISNQLLGLKKSVLQLSSNFGEGSDFFFAVAFQKVDKNTQKDIPIMNTIDQNEMEVKIRDDVKILIAEDNKINMLLAKTLINRILTSCTIIEATNGCDAVSLVKQDKPDLILMDIQMPIQNGYDATIEIREIPEFKNLPIIALTAGVLNGEKEKCLEFGMSDYVTKPIVQYDLEQVLLKWINK